jgi:5,10-methylenetetrahydromethanopterin reductase
MMELAGQMTDGVIITLCATVPYIKDIVGRVQESERASHRRRGSVDFAARIITSLSRDRGKAIRAAKQLVGRVFIHPGARPVMEASDFTLDMAAIKRAVEAGRGDRLGQLVPDSVVEMTTAAGTRSDLRRKIEEFRDAGVTLPLVVPIGRNFLDAVRAFA